MFEYTEIAEAIYECYVAPSQTKQPREDSNRSNCWKNSEKNTPRLKFLRINALTSAGKRCILI